MLTIKISITLVLLILISELNARVLLLVCYYTNWAQYRIGDAKFTPDNIDLFMCTHINYAFASLTNGVLTPYEWNDDVNYAKVMALKTINPSLKVLLSVGGWNLGSAVFSNMANDANARANFVSTSVSFLRKWKFDGLDIDWEYPASRDSSEASDKQLFTQLIKELKIAFQPFGLLLTAAVGVGFSTANAAYEIQAISNQLDFINLMTYDMHGSWEPFTGHNAPLYPRADENADQKNLNIDAVVKYWINNGTSPSKLVLGLASYGRSFTLANTAQTGLGANANGAGASFTYTGAGGMASYYEVCNCIKNGWTRIYNDEQKVPYIFKGDQWIGYDDVQSLTEKANYIVNNGLAGGMFWALDLDDFNGLFCGIEKYPLINKVKGILTASSTNSTTTLKPIVTTISATTSKLATITTTTMKSIITSTTAKLATTTTTKASLNTRTTTANKSATSSNGQCIKGDGFYPFPGCQTFYRCVYSGTSSQMTTTYACPTGTLFDTSLNICNWATSTKCSV